MIVRLMDGDRQISEAAAAVRVEGDTWTVTWDEPLTTDTTRPVTFVLVDDDGVPLHTQHLGGTQPGDAVSGPFEWRIAP